MRAVSVQQVSAADRSKLLRKLDGLEAEMSDLEAQFVAKLHEYQALVDRMRGSPLWPDTLAELRGQVEQELGAMAATIGNHRELRQ